LIVIALFCAYLTGSHIAHPFIDGDLYWQRQLGEYVLNDRALPHALGTDTFTAVGAPWVPQEWLLGTFVALVFRANALWALSVVAGIALFVTLAAIAVRSRRGGASLYSTLAALLFAGIVLESSFALRAQVLAWPLLALLLLVLDEEGNAVFWALPITVAWANLHASVMLAIPIVWIDAAAYAWKHPGKPGVRSRLLLCALVVLATLCTPLGWHLPLYAFSLLDSPIKHYINEWQPISMSTQTVAGVLPLLLLTLYGMPRLWRERPRDLVLSLLMAAWGVAAARNIALFAIVAAVPVALATGVGEGWDDPLERRPLGALALVSTIVLAPILGWIAYHAPPMFTPWPSPPRTVAALTARPGEHRLLCAEYSWCALALGKPNVRVFIDGRADPYPPHVWAAYTTVAALRPEWQQTLDAYDVNAVIVWHGGRLEQAMETLAGWSQLPQDDPCCTLFVKKS
jgi:hypothetical protein